MDISYIHGIVPLVNNTHGNSGEYFGTFADFFNLIYNNLDKFIGNTPYKDTMLETKYIPFSMICGSITGITIQRVVELYGQSHKIHSNDDELWNKDYWNDEIFTDFKNVFHNLGICKNMDFSICSKDSDCNSKKCNDWDTFYGKINYNNRLENIDTECDYINRVMQFFDGGILQNSIIQPNYVWLNIV